MAELTCRLCGHPRELVRSHVIPESFFRKLREEAAAPVIVSAGEFPRRAPIGVYDWTILCMECERRFGDLDAAGARFFLQRLEADFSPLLHKGRAVGYQAEEVNANELLRFLVSVLWRASVSTEPFFRRVSLGRLERPAISFALSGQQQPDIFDAVLSRWTDVSTIPHISKTPPILDPHPEKWDGVNAYRIFLGHYVAYIKADKRPFPPALATLGLLRAPPLRIVGRQLAGSADWRAMLETARAQIIRKPRNLPSGPTT